MSRVSQMLVAAILASILVFVIADLAGGFGDFPNAKWVAAISAICLAIWIGPRVLGYYAGNASGALKALALWLLLIVGAAALYVYGKDFLVSLGVNVP